ncbi:MAG: hypothetical protein LCH73_11330 [Proteobacteria bacterium]|nr:hypothetical protein [Pseudomonadota bacterium]
MSHPLKASQRFVRASIPVLVAVLLATTAHAASYRFVESFPAANAGISSPWSYHRRGANQTLTLLPDLVWIPYNCSPVFPSYCSHTPSWGFQRQPDRIPVVYANITDQNWQSDTGITVPRRCLMVHPGWGTKDVVVRFEVPAKPYGGSYTSGRFKGSIADLDYLGGNGVTWRVEVNGSTLYGGTLHATRALPRSSATFPTQTFNVSTGTTIDLVVSPNGADASFDTTSVCGAIVMQ